MDKPPFEVADIIRMLADAGGVVSGLRVSTAQQRVLNAITACRTAKLGGHVEECDAGCGHQRVAYNSCRNRHCPKCQARSRAEWLEARRKDLLPLPYFHVVFTLPNTIGTLGLLNKRKIYNLLFSAASCALKEVAANPKHLGAEIGFLAVLHTWGQTLIYHPHLHCVIPGGGLSAETNLWKSSRENFFLPVRVLSKLFRGKFIAGLHELFDQGQLHFSGALKDLDDAARFKLFCDKLYEKEWVVYAKPPFGGPEQVLKYLARYTHRVAIANRRILAIDFDSVTFTYKDYAQGNQQRVMSLTPLEFLRRFVQHVLPVGFVRIRHFGFLANCCRKEKLKYCRQFLHVPEIQLVAAPSSSTITDPSNDHALIEHSKNNNCGKNSSDSENTKSTAQNHYCPKCGLGRMRPTIYFDRHSAWFYEEHCPEKRDTS